ncbi:MAG: glycoside hydrolase family 3 protein [Caedimonas sp.]|nr:glycoside hydrolase family 3 protein [Caedimonas sp.]
MTGFGKRLIFGFVGCDPEDEEARRLRSCLRDELIGGVILFAHNIRDPRQVYELIQSFYEASSNAINKPLIAVDQEGGRVQRLNSGNGFHDFPSAQQMAARYTPQQAYEKYTEMAKDIRAAGFNVNFAPVVDLDHEKPSGQPCPVIGALGRSYGTEVPQVVEYAHAFVRAHRQQGILTCLKHYPGHGFAAKDSHKGLVDITQTHRPMEEQPFKELVKNGDADMVMVAHLVNRQEDADYPASLSPKTLKDLRTYYEGITVSDDLHMGAIIQHFSLEEALRQTLLAEVDLLVFSNNPKASGGKTVFQESFTLVEKIHRIVENLFQTGTVSGHFFHASCQRLKKLKEKLAVVMHPVNDQN